MGLKVKNAIREEIGDAKFCIVVDEARDESKKEQMAIVLRFVDKNGCVQELFFRLVHVKDTAALTLKDAIISILFHHSLDVQNIRGQGYDGLVLVAASKEVIPIHHFFGKLSSIINIVGASCKRNDQLKAAHASNIVYLPTNNELESGKGLNQVGSLQRAGDTHWSSHLKSIVSLMKMFSATCEVLLNIIEDGVISAQRGDADAAYEALTSFEFVFIMHLMRTILVISNFLCQALQSQSQDILNAIHLVSSTKFLIQKLRDEGWDELILKTKSFCEMVNIPIPNLDAPYIARRGRARHQEETITVEHHCRIDIFNAVIDTQLQELNRKFNDHTVELLICCSALDPREMRKSFRIDDICKLVEKFYPRDFNECEMIQLRLQFEHFHHVIQILDFEKLSTISELCQWMVKSRKFEIYPLLYRVVTLILTLPVSTATTERSFSTMNIVKTKLRSKMEDDFLLDCLLVYIEKEIVENFSIDSLIDDFRDLKERRSVF